MKRAAAIILIGTLLMGNAAYADEIVMDGQEQSAEAKADALFADESMDTADTGMDEASAEYTYNDEETSAEYSYDDGTSGYSFDDMSDDEAIVEDLAEDTDIASETVADGIEIEEESAELDDEELAADAMIEEAVETEAAEEEELGAEEIEGTSAEADEDAELLAYMNKSFGTQPAGSGRRMMRAMRRTKASYLGEKERIVYDQLLTQIEDLVSGNRTSTQFTVDMTAFPGVSQVMTEDQFGAMVFDEDSLDTDGTYGVFCKASVNNRLNELLSYDLGKVMDALTADHPELLFWYGRQYSYSRKGASLSSSDGGTVILKDTNASVKLTAGGSYQAGSAYTVDASKVASIRTAAANAKAIVDAAAGQSDYGKMDSYLNAICSANTYNSGAIASKANGISDYNPWEIIYVFDGNPNTNVVCEGYAKAFKYLCDHTSFADPSVTCCTVSGTVTGNGPAGAHMWDVVSLGGHNYIVDPTWCDFDNASYHVTTRKQFMTGAVTSGNNMTVTWGRVNLGVSGDTTYYIPAGSAVYSYDSETRALYDASELAISSDCYEVNSGMTCRYGHGQNIAEAPTANSKAVTVYYTYDSGNMAPAQAQKTAAPAARTAVRRVAFRPAPTMSLNASSVTLKVRQKSSAVVVSGMIAGDRVASATSSNSKVVASSVSGNRIVLKAGKKKGTATVTVRLASGLSRNITVKVQKGKVKASRIQISCQKNLVLRKGQSVSIGAAVFPVTTPDKVRFTSGKKRVAKVTGSGIITAKRAGKATITVKAGSKKIKIKVTVR